MNNYKDDFASALYKAYETLVEIEIDAEGCDSCCVCSQSIRENLLTSFYKFNEELNAREIKIQALLEVVNTVLEETKRVNLQGQLNHSLRGRLEEKYKALLTLPTPVENQDIDPTEGNGKGPYR